MELTTLNRIRNKLKLPPPSIVFTIAPSQFSLRQIMWRFLCTIRTSRREKDLKHLSQVCCFCLVVVGWSVLIGVVACEEM